MKSSQEILIIRARDGHFEENSDKVATEIGFSLTVNDKQVVTLLCSPIELDTMAIGFLLSEGILQKRENLLGIKVDEKNFTVDVKLTDLPDDIDTTFHKKTITSGCGRGITFTDAASLKNLPGVF